MMSGGYALNVGKNYSPDPTEPIMISIFQQYERVLIETLISSFGLDCLVKDQHGGDVDTIHNVRQIGKDEKMTYKNAQNQKDYQNRGDYNSHDYHSHQGYIDKNRQVSEQKKNGTLTDAYTGKNIGRNDKSDLDHVISAKEMHDDPGRILAGMSGTDLANSDSNLQPTNPHTNRSKKASTMDEYLSKHGDEYTEEEKRRMRKKDEDARKSYEAKVAKAYYTSPKFAKDLAVSAGNVGVRMGARQAWGFVFAEMWFAVKEEFQRANGQGTFDLADFFCSIGRGVKRGFESAKEKYAELFSRFFSGAVAGALSSITTTICNIFFTTAKDLIRIIRQTYASIVEAAKVLFINPENYSFGERMRAVAKIISTGASVVVGTIVSEAIAKTPIGTIPLVGNIVPNFCGAFVTGIMSCTLLYFFDRSEMINKLVRSLDNLHTIETEVNYYRIQAKYFEEYAAKLMNIDLETFQKEITIYNSVAASLENVSSEDELTIVLTNAFQSMGLPLPWKGYDNFDTFMGDKKSCLVFE